MVLDLLLSTLACALAHAHSTGPPAPAEHRSLSDLELVRSTLGESPWVDDGGPVRLTPPWQELKRRQEARHRFDLEFFSTLLFEGGYLRWRPEWPLASLFAVSLRAPPLESGFGIELVPKHEGWASARAGHFVGRCSVGGSLQDHQEGYQELGWLSPEQRVVRFEVHVGVRTGPGTRMRPVCLGEIEVDVRPRANFDDVLSPRRDPGVDRELSSRMLLQRTLHANDALSAELLVDASMFVGAISGSMRVELRCFERLAESAAFHHSPSDGVPAHRLSGASIVLANVPRDVLLGREPAEGWSVRLRGTPHGALRHWTATGYWAGEVDVPLAELLSRPGFERR
jgi:hypothetical protein